MNSTADMSTVPYIEFIMSFSFGKAQYEKLRFFLSHMFLREYTLIVLEVQKKAILTMSDFFFEQE